MYTLHLNFVRQVFFTRWLSFANSVQALATCVASVISATYAASAERLADGKAVLLGCAKQMATYRFLYLTAFLGDAVGILAILNKVMQKDRLTYTGLKPHIDTTILALTSLLTSDGPYLTDMRKHLPTAVTQPDFDYKGHSITDSTKERDKAHAAAKLFVEEVVARLEATFPDAGILHALTLFDSSQLNAADDDLVRYSYLCYNVLL